MSSQKFAWGNVAIQIETIYLRLYKNRHQETYWSIMRLSAKLHVQEQDMVRIYIYTFLKLLYIPCLFTPSGCGIFMESTHTLTGGEVCQASCSCQIAGSWLWLMSHTYSLLGEEELQCLRRQSQMVSTWNLSLGFFSINQSILITTPPGHCMRILPTLNLSLKLIHDQETKQFQSLKKKK